MENKKCSYLKELENKIKREKVFAIAIIILGFFIFLLKDKISLLFKNQDGQFDMSIIWAAIGALGGIIAIIVGFAGVKLTIRKENEARIKQNEYDYQKENLLNEQIEFKKMLKNELDKMNPVKLIELVASAKENNFIDVINEINSYNIELKCIEYNISWYYNNTINGLEIHRFLEMVEQHRTFIISKISSYINCISKYIFVKKYKNYFEIEKLGGKLSEQEKAEFEKLKRTYSNVDKIYEEQLNESRKISQEIVDYINANRFGDLEIKAKEVIKERSEIIKAKLEVLK